MLKLLVVLGVLASMVEGKGFGYGYGGYGPAHYKLGYGFIAGGGYGHGGYGHGHGYHRPGVAKVQVHQTPYNYNYAVNEHGPGYSKYVHQGASFHHGGYGGY